ncbi:MAG: hypothetical protein QOJ01_979 [Solirubrobacterales bacterium]|nr:hypothetical protein [Solirubrobacterales bacterium]
MSATANRYELEAIERLEDHAEDWARLGSEAGHPFATPEWSLCWWRRMSAGRELYSFALRDSSGAVIAILPLYVAATRPFRVARFLGYGDLMSPVCAPSDRAATARAMLEVTRRPHRCRAVLAERMPAEQGWGELLGGRLLRTDSVPLLRTNGMTWEEFMATKKRKFRGNLRRAEARLVEEHGLEFRLASDPDRLEADMGELFRLHGLRWGGETTGVFEGELAGFHADFAAAALRRGWLRLWLAEIEGRAVAAWYGWRFAGVDWHFQSGRDPAHDRLSVGTTLFVHTLRAAFNDGMEAYNFLAGDEGYKLHFAGEDPGAESRIVGSGPIASAAGLLIAAAARIPAGARRGALRAARPS